VHFLTVRVGGLLNIGFFYLVDIVFCVTADQIGAMCCTVYGAGKQAKYRILATSKNSLPKYI
jgi:hypothetical protein